MLPNVFCKELDDLMPGGFFSFTFYSFLLLFELKVI